ncbi:MAG TPA: hypothetical protein VJ767_05795 [Nitrososphaeraceae archaeon]|nr:hypothetical protein [Nitrososphaeraceae archaeon]
MDIRRQNKDCNGIIDYKRCLSNGYDIRPGMATLIEKEMQRTCLKRTCNSRRIAAMLRRMLGIHAKRKRVERILFVS